MLLWDEVARAAGGNVVIGYLGSGPRETTGTRAAIFGSFLGSLAEAGYIENQNLRIEFRSFEGRYDALPALIDELVRLDVAVMVTGGNVAAIAATSRTKTIPIVFNMAADPVKLGIVASLNRPGGNATGIAILTAALTIKRLELIAEIVPRTSALGFLVNPDNESISEEMERAASGLGQKLVVQRARDAVSFEQAFAGFRRDGVAGIVVANDVTFFVHREHLIGLASQYGFPAIYEWPDFPVAGGLMSYGPNLIEIYRLMGDYTARILGGTRPADLPVLQVSKFNFVINTKAAKALGIQVPSALLARADEVIE
jgi:putative ABC transport system substrate-binding protein